MAGAGAARAQRSSRLRAALESRVKRTEGLPKDADFAAVQAVINFLAMHARLRDACALAAVAAGDQAAQHMAAREWLLPATRSAAAMRPYAAPSQVLAGMDRGVWIWRFTSSWVTCCLRRTTVASNSW